MTTVEVPAEIKPDERRVVAHPASREPPLSARLSTSGPRGHNLGDQAAPSTILACPRTTVPSAEHRDRPEALERGGEHLRPLPTPLAQLMTPRRADAALWRR